MAISGATAIRRERDKLKRKRNQLARELTALDVKIGRFDAALVALAGAAESAPAN